MSAKSAIALFFSKVRFSTLLLTTIVLLVTAAVAVNLIALNLYFTKSVQTEFYDKLRAQKGQVNILVGSRIAGVRNSLKDLVENNAVRVTLMLKAEEQLEEKIRAAYPPRNGVYHFVENKSGQHIIPQTYQGFSAVLLEDIFRRRPQGDLINVDPEPKLVWLFSEPIRDKDKPMGTAYALYDFLKDKPLLETISKKVAGDICILSYDMLISPLTGISVPVAPRLENLDILKTGEFIALNDDLSLSPLGHYDNLYILYSLEKLNAETRKVGLFMGLFGVLVLGISVFAAVVLGKKLMEPLKALTRKAVQISHGEKNVRFDSSAGLWEFDQLSQAFHFMITHLQAAEEKSRYRELLEKVDDAVYLLDGDGKIMEANTAAYHQLGYQAEDFFALDLFCILPEQDARNIVQQLGVKSASDDARHMAFQTVHIRKDGEKIPVEIRSQSIEYMGKPVILNVARDVSLRVEMESALRESEERYRSVVENSSDGIMIIGEGSRIIYANALLARIFGHPLRFIEGSRLEQYLDNDNVAYLMKNAPAEKPATGNEPLDDVFQIVRRDGEQRQVKIRTNQFTDSGGSCKTVAQVFDITDQLRMEEEKKQLEDQFLHAQKLEAIGTLAGGIAHDFNNLLMGIQGRLSMMRMQMDTGDPNTDNIGAIETIVVSAANLTRQLLGFARKGQYEIKPVSINDLIEKSTQMFIRTRKEIHLQTYLQPYIQKVDVDPGQIEQVLINMYVNAWQAMPEGGNLVIETKNVQLDSAFCMPYDVEAGDYVKIAITDTGAGMDSETMRRIFEPFFTTKGVGKGTGLGLASAYGIIGNHRGIIQVESVVGQGTSFLIYLPVSRSVDLEQPMDTAGLIEGQGTVLIVDDEAESIQAEETMLQRLGYDVLVASSGTEALGIYREKQDLIDLVTLDMIMPGMGGKETFELLRQIDPDVKVLFISGYGINHDIEEIVQDDLCGFLQKPFNIVELSQKVSDVLPPGDVSAAKPSLNNLIKMNRFSNR